MRTLRAVATLAALAVSLLSGCATLTTSSSQTVTLTTDPTGAACTFKREGKVVGIVNPTPGSLMVSKSHTNIDVSCAKEGFLDAAGTVGSKFQAMTFGNILFGGLIGVVVDAASGATAEYDPSVTIVLVPAAFPTEQARDEFFDRRREEFKVESRKVKERIETMCAGGPDCGRQLKEAEVQEAVGLTRIEDQRKAARIDAAAKT
jgi:hypothetical protein